MVGGFYAPLTYLPITYTLTKTVWRTSVTQTKEPKITLTKKVLFEKTKIWGSDDRQSGLHATITQITIKSNNNLIRRPSFFLPC